METRRELLDFGLLPIGLILPGIDSLQSITDLHLKLLAVSRQIEGRKGVIDLEALLTHLKISPGLWEVLYDALEAVTWRPVGLQWPGRAEVHSIDTHSLSLFLLLQLYGRQLLRGDHEDRQDRANERNTGPAESAGHSPGSRPTAPQRSHSILNFPSFLRRHIQVLLFLVLDQPPPLNSSAWSFSRGSTNPLSRRSDHRLWVTAAEVDRLGLLLRPKEQGAMMNGMGGAGSTLPGIGDWKRLSSWIPLFRGKAEGHQVACEEVASWLVANVMDGGIDGLTADTGEEALVRIHGMAKGTVVRGEDAFPGKELQIDDCQDSCIYALAPLARVKITACTDCTVVVGAASCLIVDSCSKLRLITTCWRSLISSCHECTLHLGTNRAPVLYGDNRYLKLAPYNTSYERLSMHMQVMGISNSPNLWDQPLVLSHERAPEEGEKPAPSQAAWTGNGTAPSTADGDAQKSKVSLLPPEKLLPFTIPFKGSAGPLAGGSSSMSQFSWLGKGGVGAAGTGRSPGLPFALPGPYSDAMISKLRKVSELQESVGKAIVDSSNRRDLHVAIQGYFKDWLFNSGRIRQVYDLAKLEQQIIAERKGASNRRVSKDDS